MRKTAFSVSFVFHFKSILSFWLYRMFSCVGIFPIFCLSDLLCFRFCIVFLYCVRPCASRQYIYFVSFYTHTRLVRRSTASWFWIRFKRNGKNRKWNEKRMFDERILLFWCWRLAYLSFNAEWIETGFEWKKVFETKNKNSQTKIERTKTKKWCHANHFLDDEWLSIYIVCASRKMWTTSCTFHCQERYRRTTTENAKKYWN